MSPHTIRTRPPFGAVWAPQSARLAAALGAGAGTGWVCWGHQAGDLRSLLVIAVLPLLWGVARSRWEGAALMMGYFAAGARDLPSGAAVFFGDSAPSWWGIAMWLAVCVLLSAPFVAFWAQAGCRRGWGFVAAALACAVPPIGVFGWLHPFTLAGNLFPGWGWSGLLLTLALLGFLAAQKLKHATFVGVAAAVANLIAPAPASEPQGWLGFDTSFAKLSSAGTEYASQLLASTQRIRWLEKVAADVPANSVLVLPETLIGRFDGVAEGMLFGAETALAAKNSRVLVGAELPHGQRYDNALVVLGFAASENRAAIQGIPVPVSMWKPWKAGGATADILARGSVIAVLGRKVGVLICYEQLLTYSLLRMLYSAPDIVVAVSNVWWASSTNIPLIQSQSVRSYARLFNLPVVSAKNI